MRRKSFAQGLVWLMIFWGVAELFYGFTRDPLADTYTGDVYLVTVRNGKQVNTALDAKLKLDVVKSGRVYDRRGPDVYGHGVRMEFTGKNLDVLRKIGVSPEMINQDGRHIPFGDAFCGVSKVTHMANGKLFGGNQENYTGEEFDYAETFNLEFSSAYNLNCGKVHLGVLTFNELQLAMDEINPNGYIFADLKRDSHISPIQRWIMSMRFSRDDVETTFGG
jgi:hypothetical protein